MNPKQSDVQARPITPPSSMTDSLLHDLRHLIDQARASIASTVNAGLTITYWRVGNRVLKEILQGERAEYGKTVVATVSKHLTLQYGKGFSEKSLHRMIQFAELFPDEQILAALLRQLSWTHFTILIPIKDEVKRNFYTEMCRIERWNYRTLQQKISSMLFERTALSKKPESLIQAEIDLLRKEDRLTPDLVFRDPYFLEFLNLNDRYFEKDLEDAIMRELEAYFAGIIQEFKTPLFLFSLIGSPFQKRVWEELQKIPRGETRSYAEIAKAIGKPSAFRAVALANGANQIAIVIPCHRVINSNGDLGGYGGGIKRKEWLLKHERK
jgi:O-6-methylguanine DNA methyltransferase